VGRNKLTRNFDYKTEEPNIYAHWENNGFFKPSMNPEAPAFNIPMPPPNITGQLHMGHALFTTLQDTTIRYKRMQGFNALWQPGTDHAGLATDAKIKAELAAEGITEPTRDQYFAKADAWQKTTGGRITQQIRRLGASCDWSREWYTLSPEHPTATLEAFNRCFEKGLIYRQDGQWWLDTSQLATDLLARYHAGELKIIPEYEGKTFCHFLENIEPWCISRQIWWGHRIPIWYNGSGAFCAARTEADARAILGDDIRQDHDVLDTWFSSAIWPFAILGWPNDTPDLRTFYPASMIETAADILFFWCARMLMMGLALTDQMAFDTIYLHGIIRDANGEKMCKSKGNGIDPLLIIEKFGCDALRFGFLENGTAGQDIRLSNDIFDSAKRFANKLWQASRFCLSHFDRMGRPSAWNESQHPDDLRILASLDQTKRTMANALDAFDYRAAADAFRLFFKHEFCDWYIEASKDRLYDQNDMDALGTIMRCLDQCLRLAHPMMPYITERIWQSYQDTPLILAHW